MVRVTLYMLQPHSEANDVVTFVRVCNTHVTQAVSNTVNLTAVSGNRPRL